MDEAEKASDLYKFVLLENLTDNSAAEGNGIA
jgi:hypothetical protein